MQQVKGSPNYEVLQEARNTAHSVLTRAIKVSKLNMWGKVLQKDKVLWGRPYKAVVARTTTGSSSTPICSDLLSKIVTMLFPEQEKTTIIPPHMEEVLAITVEELMAASSWMGD